MPVDAQSDIEVNVGGVELASDAYDDLLEVRVVQDTSALSSFSLHFRDGSATSDSLEELARTDNDALKLGAEVRIGFGYVGALSPVMTGEITGIELEMHKEGPPKLVVRGYDKRHRLCRGTKTRSFVEMKDSDIAKKIAQEQGLSVSVVDSSVTHAYVLQDSLSDFEFLRQRAEQAGFVVGFEGGELYFGPDKYGESAAVELTKADDIIEIYLNLSALGLISSVVVQGWDPATKTAVAGTAAAGDIATKMGATLGVSAAESAFGAAVITSVDRGVDAEDVAAQMALGRLTAAALDYIQGEATCYGNAKLKAGVVVDISGLGRRFSGSYYVASATHTYSPEEGYRTGINLRRNAT